LTIFIRNEILMRFKVIVSILVLSFIASCSGLKKTKKIPPIDEEVFVIHPSFKKLTYEAEIHYFGTNHKGKFHIEKTRYDKKTHFVLSTEDHMKLFDISIDKNDSLKFEYLDESLDSDRFRHIIEEDFKLLTKITVKDLQPEYFNTTMDSLDVQIYNTEDHHYLYIYHKSNKFTKRIESSGLIGKDSYIELIQRKNGHPSTIDIHHPKIGLRLLFEHK
jgi:hypothetical protein